MGVTIPKTGAIRIESPYVAINRQPTTNYDVGSPASAGAPTVNMWAKYKPQKVSPDTPAEISDATRKANNWGLSCNIDNPDLGVPKASAYQLANVKWTYNSPGSADFKRLTDWQGYEHEAEPPVAPTEDITIYGSQSSYIYQQRLQVQSENNLKLSDFAYLGDKYLAIAVYNAQTNAFLGGFTAASTIANGGFALSYPPTGITAANIGDLNFAGAQKKYVLCAANAKATTVSEFASIVNRLYPLPSANGLSAAFAFTAQSPIEVNFYGVATSKTSRPITISFHQPQIGQDANYFSCKNGFWLYMEIENKSTFNVTLTHSNIHLRTTKTLVTASGNTSQVNFSPSAIFKCESGTTPTDLSQYTLAPGAKVRICFDAKPLAYGLPSGGTSTVVTNTNIELSAAVRWATDTVDAQYPLNMYITD